MSLWPPSRARSFSSCHCCVSPLHASRPALSHSMHRAHRREPPTEIHRCVARRARSASCLVERLARRRLLASSAAASRCLREVGRRRCSLSAAALGHRCVASPTTLHAVVASAHRLLQNPITAETGLGCNPTPCFARWSAHSLADRLKRSSGASCFGTSWCALTFCIVLINSAPSGVA